MLKAIKQISKVASTHTYNKKYIKNISEIKSLIFKTIRSNNGIQKMPQFSELIVKLDGLLRSYTAENH